jgi:biopolymer transport protein ExbD
MDLFRLKSLLAPLFIALFGLLTVCNLAVQAPLPSTGIKIPLLRLSHHEDQLSCDGRWVFVELLNDGKTKINEEEIHDEDLAPLVSKIMESRAERVIYVVPYPEIPYSRFVETLSTLKKAVPDLHVGVLSGKVRDAYMQPGLNRHYLPCDIVWPAGDF